MNPTRNSRRSPIVESLEGRNLLSTLTLPKGKAPEAPAIVGQHIGVTVDALPKKTLVTDAIQGNHIGIVADGIVGQHIGSVTAAIQGNHIGTNVVTDDLEMRKH